MGAPQGRGRPRRTSHAQLERVALALFSELGYEQTTVEHVARAAGVGRRTLFRYFASKRDMVWGDFDQGLQLLASRLAAADSARPLFETLREQILAFNALRPEDVPLHRARMRLILQVPDLQSYATLRYAQWRAVVAAHVAAATGGGERDLVPQTTAHALLGACLTGYQIWLDHPGRDLHGLLGEALDVVGAGLSTVAAAGSRRCAAR